VTLRASSCIACGRLGSEDSNAAALRVVLLKVSGAALLSRERKRWRAGLRPASRNLAHASVPFDGISPRGQQYFDWFKYEFWRFVFVQQEVEKLAKTAIEFPPMQKGASFNLDAVKAKIAAASAAIAK
jgi:hypothetical protein